MDSKAPLSQHPPPPDFGLIIFGAIFACIACVVLGRQHLRNAIKEKRKNDCLDYFKTEAPNLYLKLAKSYTKPHQPTAKDYALESAYRVHPETLHSAIVSKCQIKFDATISHPVLTLPCYQQGKQSE